MSLALACDLVVAAESARFTAAYTRIGLCPDGSMTYTLSRLVGMRRALELTLTNRTLTAQQALDWGIITAIAPEGAALQQADMLASQFAQGPTLAFGATKRLIHQGWTEGLETQMLAESQAITAMSGTADAAEGMSAFVAKRVPNFTGK